MCSGGAAGLVAVELSLVAVELSPVAVELSSVEDGPSLVTASELPQAGHAMLNPAYFSETDPSCPQEQWTGMAIAVFVSNQYRSKTTAAIENDGAIYPVPSLLSPAVH